MKEPEVTEEEFEVGMAEPPTVDTSTMVKNSDNPNYKKEKYIALYQARSILADIGTMGERNICKRQLDRMKKKGLASV